MLYGKLVKVFVAAKVLPKLFGEVVVLVYKNPLKFAYGMRRMMMVQSISSKIFKSTSNFINLLYLT